MTEEQLLSWKETFYEITIAVHCSILNDIREEAYPGITKSLYPGLIAGIAELGSGWLREQCMVIADKFEEQYKDEDWIDLDWYDTVYEFTTNYLQNL